MPIDARIPGITLRVEEEVVAIYKPHWVVFIRLVNIFILPLLLQFFRWKNELYVLTTQRVVEQYGVISTAQRSIELDKIQDVNFASSGILMRLLGVGIINVETGGSSSRVEMSGIARPRNACDQIQNEMASAKKRAIMQMAQAMRPDSVRA